MATGTKVTKTKGKASPTTKGKLVPPTLPVEVEEPSFYGKHQAGMDIAIDEFAKMDTVTLLKNISKTAAYITKQDKQLNQEMKAMQARMKDLAVAHIEIRNYILEMVRRTTNNQDPLADVANGGGISREPGTLQALSDNPEMGRRGEAPAIEPIAPTTDVATAVTPEEQAVQVMDFFDLEEAVENPAQITQETLNDMVDELVVSFTPEQMVGIREAMKEPGEVKVLELEEDKLEAAAEDAASYATRVQQINQAVFGSETGETPQDPLLEDTVVSVDGEKVEAFDPKDLF